MISVTLPRVIPATRLPIPLADKIPQPTNSRQPPSPSNSILSASHAVSQIAQALLVLPAAQSVLAPLFTRGPLAPDLNTLHAQEQRRAKRGV